MSSGIKCKNCGSTDIEEDNARGDAVCTNCGSVLEDNIIVSEVQFEEGAHGASSAIGQFVSSESTGGATVYGKFQVGSGTESREVTIKRAKIGITHLCNQLQLSQHYIDTALNFFKMALMRHLTRGRKNTHIYAACVYITCRTEGTSHLLIDISDVLQICSYELGRTYLKLSNALCINIPSVDPCLYIMRFANKLQFSGKTHEVSMTALRIVQRMKKDSIHSGRRPTGLCGAALLMAARMHEFNRTITDIVKIVKIHESTVRKRLTEFAETPSSALTLDEFMAVDLEAEQDPPAFKAARKRDKERIQKIGENELTSLQLEIDAQLEKDLKKTYKKGMKNLIDDFEEIEAENFVNESTSEVISEYLVDDPDIVNETKIDRKKYIEGLKPDIISMCTPPVIRNDYINYKNNNENKDNDYSQQQQQQQENEDLDLEGLDDDEINGYIMSEKEAHNKNLMWMKLNAEYLDTVKAKEEKLAKEREEGKPEKKKRKPRKKIIGPSNSAGEAIEKMLQEKKISSKINYDILKSLTEPKIENNSLQEEKNNDDLQQNEIIEIDNVKKRELPKEASKKGVNTKRLKLEIGLPVADSEPEAEKEVIVESGNVDDNEDADASEVEPEPENEPEPEYSSLKDMLNNGEDDDYYGYDEEQY